MTTGVDPTLAAILPLVGVVLGAVVGAGSSFILQRRSERADIRATARVLVSYLDYAKTAIEFLIATDRRAIELTDGRGLFLHEQWSRWLDSQTLVARHVNDAQWDAISEAFFDAVNAGFVLSLLKDDPERWRKRADAYAESFKAGADALASHAYSSPVHERPGASRPPEHVPKISDHGSASERPN